MPYEESFTSDEMLDGYAPSAVMPATEPPPVADFDPRRDIDPMARKLFDDIGSRRHLRPEDKIALQSKLLAGISDVSAQRTKLEAERRQSMMDNMRIQEMQGSLASMRQRQQTAVEQTAARATFTDAVKGVMARTDLDPVAKSMEIDRLTTENLGFVAADPDAARVVSTAKSMIPLPKVSNFTDAQIMDATEAGVPADVVATGNPYLIGSMKAMLDAERKAQSEKADERREAKKSKALMIRDLAKEDFRFLTDEERLNLKVDYRKGSEIVRNPEEYLNPEDHDRGRLLARMVLGPEGYTEFEKLSDAEKREQLRELRFRAMDMALDEATSETKSDEDVAADKLFGR